jgi:zinc/manganese transport system substrate-binding protein
MKFDMISTTRTPLRRKFLLAAVGLFCLAGIAVNGADLRIVTTTSDLAAIARAVAGDAAEVSSITDGRRDPHFLQAKPSYIMAARNADLWIRVGMELEVGWEGPILRGSRNAAIQEGTPGHLDASQGIIRLGVPTGKITRAMGDVHPTGNPHYWLDPLNGRIVAAQVADRLIALRPERAEHFRQNLAAFQQALDARMFGPDLAAAAGGDALWALLLNGQLDAFLADSDAPARLGGWLATMRPYQGTPVILYHQSWNYFINRFGLRIAAELESKPGVPPTASHLQDVIDTASAQRVRLILVEPFYNRKAADKVAAASRASVVVCANSVGGQEEARDYLSLIDQIVDKVVNTLADAETGE